MMTLNELKYLVALSELKHFGQAAEQCFVSQPTLSVAIKKLEEKLNVALFERRNQQIDLTPIGMHIVQRARKVLQEVSDIQAIAQNSQDPLQGEIRLGAIFTIAPYLLPVVIPELHQQAPKMPLYIEENFTASLRKQLIAGEIDAAVVAMPFTGTDLVTRPLYEEEFVVLAPYSHPVAQMASVSQEQLADETLLLLGEGHCVRDQIMQSCPAIQQSTAEKSAPMRSLTSGSSLETLKYMVASGMGLTILPSSAARLGQYNPNLIKVVPFAANPPTRTVALSWRATYTRPKAMELIASVIKHSHDT
ncbi:hydrogen peroxide-inducible genes activator [Gynuella sunshinyii]|uniref:Transcriptional regulator n=1 Tax=Gynuella sunshinyii YC6258 TaxID=1445510 RepID=A0A0C5VHU3_9GAMM|nr:transcriptional regulator [Gynuella sunshinyii YC6258]